MVKLLFSSFIVPAIGVSSVQTLTACIAREKIPSFAEFIGKYHRTFDVGNDEYEFRKALFDQRAVEVRSQNCQPGQTWKAEMNRFSDQTSEELAQFRGWKSNRRSSGMGSATTASAAQIKKHSQLPLPESVDWTDLHALRRPRDQGSCGSCWAFAASTVLAANHEIHRRENRTFSVQQMVACTPNPEKCGGSGGCDGATAELAFEYVLRSGCSTEIEFPYRSLNSACPSAMLQVEEQFAGGSAFGMVGWTKLPENEMQPVMRALYERGPLAVAVGVTDTWMSYRSGVMNFCSPNVVVNHAVTLVGYGADSGGKFWHLLNSWGAGWGEEGFFRLVRHDSEADHCGWDNAPLDGSECAHGPEPPRDRVWVCGMCAVLSDVAVPLFARLEPDETVSVPQSVGLLEIRGQATQVEVDREGDLLGGA